ncbi:MAG: nuclear transport factor 2 family protein [Blastocatellales bacterium]
MKTQSRLVLFIVLLLAAAFDARAQQAPQSSGGMAVAKPAGASEADLAAIKQTALDYIEGYYEGNGERMERALHPELAKRIVHTDPKSGRSRLDQMSAMTLALGTRARASRPTPKEKRQNDVTVLDVFENAASVKIVAADWIDYLHVAKFNGRWVIVNVLWELKPQQK